jgi:hypothetical protein
VGRIRRLEKLLIVDLILESELSIFPLEFKLLLHLKLELSHIDVAGTDSGPRPVVREMLLDHKSLVLLGCDEVIFPVIAKIVSNSL